MGITINAAGQFLNNGQVTTYTTAQLAAMGLPVTADEANWNPTQWEQYWQQHITNAWAAGHHGQSMPQDQTIMVVTPGDCQWNIAKGAGADPVTTAYSTNPQISNPDLIHPGDIEFVSPTTKFATTTTYAGGHSYEYDNTGIFANQTFADTPASTTYGKGNFGPVTGSVDAYLNSIPGDPHQIGTGDYYTALKNLILDPNWGTIDSKGSSSDSGNYGRQIILNEYFNKNFSNPAQAKSAGVELKVSLGLGTEGTPTTSDGVPTFSANKGLTPDQQNLVTQIDQASGLSA
jgi:hypothetical protein